MRKRPKPVPAARPRRAVERTPEPVREQSGHNWAQMVQFAVVITSLTVLIACGMSVQEAAGVIGAGFLLVGDMRDRRP
ncbi:hypothetical protein [Streptomyces violascens]|uniref:hypothetical protein n=1 Tax=Streptomyces violascens TaxID=67381 RepID=UPI0036BD7901